jgi:hypothetical protein
LRFHSISFRFMKPGVQITVGKIEPKLNSCSLVNGAQG